MRSEIRKTFLVSQCNFYLMFYLIWWIYLIVPINAKGLIVCLYWNKICGHGRWKKMPHFRLTQESIENTTKITLHSCWTIFFPQEVATLWNKWKMAAVSRRTQKHPRNSQSQITFVPGTTEEYKTQVFEKTEGKVIKKMSQVFSRTESRIFGALSKIDNFLLKPRIRTLI